MSFQIPLFDLNYDEQEERAVVETLRSKWISTGPKCTALEDLFKDYLHVDHALATSSCTTALHLAMRVLGISKGDEVIVPSLTFAATVNAVKYVEATPVFADLRSTDDLTIDPADIRRKITPKTKAIVVMHYAGFPCAMDQIVDIAAEFQLKIVEDACHAPLSQYARPSASYASVKQGTALGAIGDVGVFSFFSNKNISTGEGGMLVTNDEAVYEQAKLLRSHGMTTMSYERAKGHATSYDILDLGYNFRMDDIRASLGIVQMKKLPADLKRRAEVRSWYLEELKGIPELGVPFADYEGRASNYIMPVVLKDATRQRRDELRALMQKEGIQTSVHYPAVHRFSIYQALPSQLPITDYVADNEVTLPMYGNLSQEDVKCVCDVLKHHWLAESTSV
ncbi:MAG: aminotransferase class I/II-fold pyridoxal phosphate-dependent enzyme [Bacteroidetes bacterium]|jgi:dTDP-4-amino-4,6-dideoxygalactose transaminase|nr:aminotransferase class I/II-fold pyridoxal phosphate-dependent enzyme [Bacteroidota bacterium]